MSTALENVLNAAREIACMKSPSIEQLLRQQGFGFEADRVAELVAAVEALPEAVDNPEEIENVISILQNLEIDILDPDEVEGYKQRQGKPRRRRPATRRTTSSTIRSGCTSSRWARSRC